MFMKEKIYEVPQSSTVELEVLCVLCGSDGKAKITGPEFDDEEDVNW